MAAAGHGCESSGTGHAGATRLCTPGANVFCNCLGGKESGTKTCLDSGQAFGPCEPCLGLPEQDAEPRIAPDTSTGAPDTAVAPEQSDKCPGAAAALTTGEPLTLSGDTAPLKSNYNGAAACGSAGQAKDAVHAFTASVRGRVKLELKPAAGFDGTLYVRRGSCEGTDQAACAEAGGAGVAEKAQVALNAGETVFAFVDGKDTSSGAYTLVATFEEGSACGDGLADPDEICDDGNEAAGDGCSPQCEPEPKSAKAKTCPGQPIHVWSDPVEFAGSTSTFANASKSTCGGTSARDAVYGVVAHRGGTLHVETLNATFDVVMYARAAPCATGKELGCSSLFKGQGGEKLDIPVANGDTIYVIIDGFKTEAGEFALSMAID
ncbi:MAG: hypothetical protein FJ100_13765 [Deltaproteobacteria bacterium]|nr:hypothetical protein [Deltaproteobacteria bacterium]